MKKQSEWKIAAGVIICLLTIAGSVQGQKADESDSELKGEVRLRFDNFSVNKDAGRFREDQWRTDGSTGGLDWLHLESNGPDKNGYEWIFEGRALYDYDYMFSLLMKKENSHYLKLDFTGLRRYYDGSNEFWDQTLYGLPGSDPRGTNEHRDGGLFVDRRNYNIEFGLTSLEGMETVLGWHRLEKDGKEVLARGGLASNAGQPNFYGIPAIANIRGITDTFYAEIAQTLAEKYNFRLRQEFEQYHDEQLIVFPQFDSGSLAENQTFQDEPGYTNWRTMFMFDSFLDEETYVTANYMYNYLNNDSSRDASASLASPDVPLLSFINSKVGNSKKTNVGAFGYRKANIMPSLHFSAGLRVEDSSTSSKSLGFEDGTTLQTAMSKLDEVRVAETLRLVYEGIEKTTLSFDADLEQRDMGWDNRTVGPLGDDFDRSADIKFQDQIYTLKAVHRFNSAVRSTFKFLIKDLERDYTERWVNDPTLYPGHLGNYHRKANNAVLRTDWRINSTTNTTLMYQFLQENIDTQLGGETQDFEIHRSSASLSLNPGPNLFLVGTFMLENYKLDTPASGDPTNNIATGPRPFDFRGNSYSLLLNGTYGINEKTSCNFGYQHTVALGTVDFAGDYVYDKFYTAFKFKVTKNKTVSVGYQFLNFNNHDGGSFDDYRAHGVLFTYTYKF